MAGLRGTNIVAYPNRSTGTFPTIDIGLPPGCQVGDLAYVFACASDNASGATTLPPGGWVTTYNGGPPFDQNCYSGILTTTDLTPAVGFPNGVIHVPTNPRFGFPTPYDSMAAIAVMVGAPTQREVDGMANSYLSAPLTATTSSAVVSSDSAIYFGSSFNDNAGTSLQCLSRGDVLQELGNAIYCMTLAQDGPCPTAPYSVGFSAGVTSISMNGLIIILENTTLAAGTPSVSAAAPANGTVGVPYTGVCQPNNLSCINVFSVTSGSLPPGLSLNSSSGAITGTPTTAGVYNFDVQVLYGNVPDYPSNPLPFSVTGPSTITIDTGISVSCNNPPPGTVGQPYSHSFTASGGTPPYTFSVITGILPPGLSMDSAGDVSGTPTLAGTYPFTVQVTDSFGQTGTVNCSIAIGAQLVIECGNPPVAILDEPYSHTFPASGGTPPYTFAIISGSLPPGLTLGTSTGVVSGTPTSGGTYPFTIQVTDSTSATASVACSIPVVSLTPCTFQPPDLTQVTKLRMVYADAKVIMFFQDVTGIEQVWVYTPARPGWIPYEYYVSMNAAYWEEVESLVSELLLGQDGNVYQVGGTSDNGRAIPCEIKLPYLQNSRTEKFFGDAWLDADPQSATNLSLIQTFDLQTVANAAQAITGTGRTQYPLNTSNSNGQLARNAGLVITWSTAGAPPILYEFDPWFYDTGTVLRTSWASLPTSHGLAGWQHLREGYLPLWVATPGTINLLVTIDGGQTFTVQTLPVTPGGNLLQKIRIDFPPAKGLMFEYQLQSATPFLIFEKDLEILAKSWGSTGAYVNVKPFGDRGE